MKLIQENVKFAPIALVIESADEAAALWDLARLATSPCELTQQAVAMAGRISDWMSNEAHL